MKKVKLFFLSLMTIVMCGLTTSCDPNDVVGEVMDWNEYFISLDAVETNLVDASGNSLAKAISEEFKFDKSGAKTQSLGKMADDTARETFKLSCDNIEAAYKAVYQGVMPQGGYIEYYLSLRVHTSDGGKLETRTIVIK